MSGTRQRSYVGPAFADAKVHDAMRVGVVTCQPSTTLEDAARTMNGFGIHCLIVADAKSGGHTGDWGVVDALDVARAEAEGKASTVGEVAVTDAVTIDSNAPLSTRRPPHGRERQLAPGGGAAWHRPTGGVISTTGLTAVLAWGRSA